MQPQAIPDSLQHLFPKDACSFNPAIVSTIGCSSGALQHACCRRLMQLLRRPHLPA